MWQQNRIKKHNKEKDDIKEETFQKNEIKSW